MDLIRAFSHPTLQLKPTKPVSMTWITVQTRQNFKRTTFTALYSQRTERKRVSAVILKKVSYGRDDGLPPPSIRFSFSLFKLWAIKFCCLWLNSYSKNLTFIFNRFLPNPSPHPLFILLATKAKLKFTIKITSCFQRING